MPQDSNLFSLPSTPSSNGFGLPSSKIPANRNSRSKRNLMHWFVPEVGIVDMYINPSSVNYEFSKIITKERTKGGYSIQYWGEELPKLRISGSTGTSGIEGINVLHEVYRSEQLTFDSVGLSLAAADYISNIVDAANSSGILGGIGTGLLGLNPLAQSTLPKTLPTLASLAFGVELYWSGWVFRGFFMNFSFDEKADNLGLFNYNIEFIVTQRRGYRYNFMPWHHSAVNGPSNHDAIQYTFEDTNARGGNNISSETASSNVAGIIGTNPILRG